jgi:hypothetical protein
MTSSTYRFYTKDIIKVIFMFFHDVKQLEINLIPGLNQYCKAKKKEN